MNFNFKAFKRDLSEYRVFDAWQYVESLLETLTYMDISYALLEKVTEHQKKAFDSVNQEILEKACANPGKTIPITLSPINRGNIQIAGFDVGSGIFLRKTTIEFFHYARLSIDILTQIINAALYGDDAFPINAANLPSKITNKLIDNNSFPTLHSIISNMLSNPEIQYMMAFDNYVKHIKTILITIKNNLLLSQGTDQFDIMPFTFKGTSYPAVNAVQKAKIVRDEVLLQVDQILSELQNQLPKSLGNANRYQLLKFKQVFKKTNHGLVHQYIAFFLEVDNGISDLASEISIMPLIVKPNGEVCNFFLDFDTVFVTMKNQGEDGICGIAEAQPLADSNELYRKFIVKPATKDDYLFYLANFKRKYTHLHINYNALEGEIITYKDSQSEGSDNQ